MIFYKLHLKRVLLDCCFALALLLILGHMYLQHFVSWLAFRFHFICLQQRLLRLSSLAILLGLSLIFAIRLMNGEINYSIGMLDPNTGSQIKYFRKASEE